MYYIYVYALKYIRIRIYICIEILHCIALKYFNCNTSIVIYVYVPVQVHDAC